MGQECFEGLEAGIDALHAPTFITVGDLAADSSLLVLGRLWTEGDVGQAERGQRKKMIIILSMRTLCQMRPYKLLSNETFDPCSFT